MPNLDAKEAYGLILQLRDSAQSRIQDAINRLPEILELLGPERTIHEFIPYILETTGFTEKNWIDIMSAFESLPFEKYSKEQINNFLDAFVFFTEMNSKLIRKKFIDLLCKILRCQMSLKENVIIPFLKKLLQNEWYLVQLTGIQFIQEHCYLFDEKIISELIDITFKDSDQTQMTIRLALVQMGKQLLPHISFELQHHIYDVLYQIFRAENSHTVLSEFSLFLSEYSKYCNDINELTKFTSALNASNSWRVHCMFILHFTDIFSPLLKQILDSGANENEALKYMNPLIDAFSNEEDEIRTAAASQLKIFDLFSKDSQKVKSDLATYIDALLTDSCVHTRTTIVSILPWASKFLEQKTILEKLTCLIKDQSREVKLAAIDALKDENIPRSDAIISLLELTKNSTEWREKASISEMCSYLIHGVNLTDPAIEPFTQLVELLLFDDSYDVRMKMIDSIHQITQYLSNQFIDDKFIPLLRKGAENADYQMRQTVITAIFKLSLEKKCADIIDKELHDSISNVRLTIAKYCKDQAILAGLLNDPDSDVVDIAQSNLH